MNFKKNIKYYLILTIISTLSFSCSNDDDCTKMVNIPKWDPIEMTFVDNLQEVSCNFEEPVDGPVNGITNKNQNTIR